jgi:hypothetical protein
LKIWAGFDIAFNCAKDVPMLLMLTVHPSRRSDLLSGDKIEFSPKVQARGFQDAFGNICTRLVAPPGIFEIRSDFIVADSGQPDLVVPDAKQWPVETYPTMPSRIYSAADIATRKNWQTEPGLFSGKTKVAGGARMQFANTFMIVSSLGITTPEMIAPRGKDMRSASAFAGISPIWLSRFVDA